MAHTPPWYAFRGAAAIVIALLLAAVALDARVANATTATWAGGIGVLNDATNWDTNPLFPCNGQGGDVYDVVIASGTITLNLDCSIDSLSQSGSTFGGSFDLTILGQFDWTSGTRGGSGTTQIDGGLNVTAAFNKTFSDTHTLIHTGGTGTWTAGTIGLGGGGATFSNATTWNVTGDVNHTMSDTSDSGSFENTSSGVLNVDPDASYAAGNTLVSGAGTLNVTDAGDTIKTGSARMSGGNLGGLGTLLSTGSFPRKGPSSPVGA
jgi:hypothetical protein